MKAVAQQYRIWIVKVWSGRGFPLVVAVLMLALLLPGCLPGGEPGTASGWLERGDELRASGDVVGAIAAYQEALKLEPESVLAHLKLARALEQTGDREQSIAEYLRCIDLDPKLAAPFYALGFLLAREGIDPVLAASCVERGLEVDPNIGNYIPEASQLALTCINKGVSLAQAHNYPGAIGYLELARLLAPGFTPAEDDLAAAYNNYGLLLGGRGDILGARRSFEQAIRIDPGLEEAYSNLGVVLGMEGDLQGAREQFQHAIDIDPGFVDAWNNMGVVLAAMGKLPQAQGSFAQALSLATSSEVYAHRIPRVEANLEAVTRSLAGEQVDVSALFSFEGYFGSPAVELDLHTFYGINRQQIEELVAAGQERQCQEGMTALECQLGCYGTCALDPTTGCWECLAGEMKWSDEGILRDYQYSGLLLLQIDQRSQLEQIAGEMVLRFVPRTESEAQVDMEQAWLRTVIDLDGDGVFEVLQATATGQGTLDLRSGRMELANHVQGVVEISSAEVERFSLSFMETGFYDFQSGQIYLASEIFYYNLASLTAAPIGVCLSKVAEERGLKVLDERNREQLRAQWEKQYLDWEKEAIAKADLAGECQPPERVTTVECVVRVKTVGMELLPFGFDTVDEYEKYKHVMQAGEEIMGALGWVIFASDVGSAVSKGKLFKIATPQAGDAAGMIWKAFKDYLEAFHRELWVTYEVQVYRRYLRFRCQNGQWIGELVWQEPEERWTKGNYLAHITGSGDELLAVQGKARIERAKELIQSRAEELAREIYHRVNENCPQGVSLPGEILVPQVIDARKMPSK